MKLLSLVLALLPILATSSSKIATGIDLLSEMNELHDSLSRLQTLLKDEALAGNDEIMDKAAKVFRRARWLIYSSHHDVSQNPEVQRAQHLRGGIGSGEMHGDASPHIGKADLNRGARELPEDHVARNMYDATITFPECKELYLEDCLQLISEELAELSMSAEVVIHEKRSPDQPGYNKVVIVTDLAAEVVLGRDNNGIVTYPFMWNDSKLGTRILGVDGKWDCKSLSPEECCANIQESVPNPDDKGNYIECHIFVPFGGAGNKKRSDRVFVNLSQDGRVQESPFVS